MSEEKVGVANNYKAEDGGPAAYIKGAEFDSGLTLEVVGMEKFSPDNLDYGVKNTYGPGGVVVKEHWFVKNGILAEGESFRYKFRDAGFDRYFDNASLSFYFAFTKINPIAGNKLKIKRNKIAETKVEWDISVI